MKKLYTTFCLVLFCTGLLQAQGTVTISGDTCLGSYLTAKIRNDVAKSIEWWQNDTTLMQVRGKWGQSSVVAGGNGGGSDSTQFSDTRGIFVDKNLNLYVVDNTRVQRWAYNATYGTTVAGGNGKGSALNQFYSPYGIWVDENENVFVADYLMERVVKWPKGATTGIVIAGGHGSGSALNQFSGPNGIWMDKLGNLYVSDRWNARVMKWTPGASQGKVVAGGNGSGSAYNQLIEPNSVSVDTSGNVYVCDTYNHRIMKWAPGAVTGVVVAGGNGYGTKANQLNSPWHVFVDSASNIYVDDNGNYRIQLWKPGTTYVITVAGGYGYGGNVKNVYTVYGMFVDKAGSIYAAEIFEDRVRKFVTSSYVDSVFNAPVIGKYSSRANFENGSNAQSNVSNVLIIPERPHIKAPLNVKYGKKNVSFSVINSSFGSNYTWLVPSDATITSGQGTAAIKVTWGTSSGDIAVYGSNICGASQVRSKFINAIPPSLQKSSEPTELAVQVNVVYPNPAIDEVTVQLVGKSVEKITMQVTDVAGKIILQRQVKTMPGVNKQTLDISNLAKGNYYIRCTNGDRLQVYKFCKQ